ncbi:polysaccharide deacetylase family protein [soil metagenome]
MDAVKKVAAAGIFHFGLWRPYFHLRRPRQNSTAAILTFHRLVDDRDEYLLKGPTVQSHARIFEQVVAVLARYYSIISLNDIVAHLKSDEPFARDSVAIVFDDGYEDNFRLGLPVLTRYGVPATVFIAAGFIDRKDLMWTDRVEQGLLQTRRQGIDLGCLGLELPYQYLPLQTRGHRIRATIIMSQILKDLNVSDLAGTLRKFEAMLGTDPSNYPRRMMTWGEVRALADSGIDIGSHGVSHAILTKLGFQEACGEIRVSKAIIEDKIQRPVRHFAYPNGREEDFSDALRDACVASGYDSVSSCVWGVNRPHRDTPFFLKRIGLIGGSAPTLLLSLERLFRAEAVETGESLSRSHATDLV